MVESIQKLTPELFAAIGAVHEGSTQLAFDELKGFLVNLGPQGTMACLGFRKTHSPTQKVPPERTLLVSAFNRRHTVLTPEQLS